jgi:2-hydroxychromene-2-carboxylate isomerase
VIVHTFDDHAATACICNRLSKASREAASMSIQFWFEFASTYSYLTAMRIETLASRAGIAVEWRPFLLGPIFRQQGWTDSPFNLYPAKGRYMWRDMARQCRKYELQLTTPSTFPRNGLTAARIACRHADAPWLPGFVRAIYRANFVDDQDISAEAVIGQCLIDLGQNPDAIMAVAQLPQAKQALIAQTDEAMRLGVFGAPSFIAGGELFWGDDRLQDALDHCLASARATVRE